MSVFFTHSKIDAKFEDLRKRFEKNSQGAKNRKQNSKVCSVQLITVENGAGEKARSTVIKNES